jgi:hypothetical protein
MDQPTKTNPFVKTPILKILGCIIALYEGAVEVLVIFYRVVKGVRTIVELNLAEKKYAAIYSNSAFTLLTNSSIVIGFLIKHPILRVGY